MLAQKDTRCYVCGPDNPHGLKTPFSRFGDSGSQTVYTARQEHAGWQGVLHGGVIFSLLDEALGWALFFQHKPSVTARAEMKFLQPVRVGSHVIVRGWSLAERKSLIDARAEMRLGDWDGPILASVDAIMKRISNP